MKRLFGFALAGMLVLGLFSNPAFAEGDMVKVMTQNQYLGADLTPLVTAATPDEFFAAADVALQLTPQQQLLAHVPQGFRLLHQVDRQRLQLLDVLAAPDLTR